MYINITGYDSFSLYVCSNGENNYDYLMVSELDADLTTSSTYGSTGVKAHTKGNTASGAAITNYTKVSYTDIDPTTTHKITIAYRKDGSGHYYEDRGYVIIVKQ
jgi:hypothetical protein